MKTVKVSMSVGDDLHILQIPYGFETEGGYVGAHDALALAFFAFKQEVPVDSRNTAANPGGLY